MLPTQSENIGMVVAEALASGVPVLRTTGTPWRELEQIGAGRCVEVSAIRPGPDRLLSAPRQELAHAGERGRDWVTWRFGWSSAARSLLAFYEELGARSGGVAASGS